MLPVVLYILNLPNGVLGARGTENLAGVADPEKELASKGFAPELGFKQLEAAAHSKESREENAGKTVRLIGMYAGDDDQRFNLARYQVKCCAADAVPLNAIVMLDPNSNEKIKPRDYRSKWVEVTGQLQFLQRPSSKDPKAKEYIAAVIVYPKPDAPLKDLVKIIPQPPNPYLN
jgi:uncharacterized membrane protein YcgQ (UPF0703/DUF1980 family)